jgi:Ca2+-binding RTX toxin-like protein
VGADASERITVVNAPGGDRFVVSDTAPITAGAGCTPTPIAGAGLHAVSCLAPRLPSGEFRRFDVDAAGGDDIVNNSTVVGMIARGGPGNDLLNGGPRNDTISGDSGRDVLHGNGDNDILSTVSDAPENALLSDTLDGGNGNDTLRAGPGRDMVLGGDGHDRLLGGLGADTLDAGPGLGDVVSYGDHVGAGVIVSLDNTSNDGAAMEGDNVRDSAETVQGSSGDDTLSGNTADNHLIGGSGGDRLIGNTGADLLEGGPGNDALFSNQRFGITANIKDGAIDTLNGGTDFDSCRIPPVTDERDITISCEISGQGSS